MTVKCPKCGRMLEVTGMQPGSSLTCQCGNVVMVPRQGMSRRTLYVLIAVGLVVLACPCIGILAAIAIPNFIRFQSRAKQTECKVNLKSFYTAQRGQNDGTTGFEPDLSKVGFSPERGNRYAYFVGRGPMEERSGPQATGVEGALAIGVDTHRYPDQRAVTFDDLPPELAPMVGVSGQCPDCNITMVCAGDLDKDRTLDVWSISTADRQAEDGTPIMPGEPYQHVNDVLE